MAGEVSNRVAASRTLSNAVEQPADAETITARVRALAQSHVADAIRTLAEIAGDANVPPTARVSAANSILDRAAGKPTATIESSHTQTNIVQLHLSALESLSQGAMGPVIDHDPR